MSSSRLCQLSHRMAILTLVMNIAILALNAASWLYPAFRLAERGIFDLDLSPGMGPALGVDLATATWWQLLGAIVLSSIPLLALAIGLTHLRRLFQAYARQDYFSTAAAIHLGKLGKGVLAWVGLNLVCEPLLSLWLTLRAAPGHHAITVSFQGLDVVALFLAASITVIAHILQKASELDAEHRQFI